MPTKHLASALLFTAALSACTPDNGTQNTASGSGDKTGSVKLLNVSYDVARDLYKTSTRCLPQNTKNSTTARTSPSNNRTAVRANRHWPWPTA